MHGGKIGSSVQRNHSLEHFYSKVLHSNTTSQTRLKKPRQLESHLKPKFTKSLKYQTLDVADQIAQDVTRLLGGIKDVWVLLKCENKSENFKENSKKKKKVPPRVMFEAWSGVLRSRFDIQHKEEGRKEGISQDVKGLPLKFFKVS